MICVYLSDIILSNAKWHEHWNQIKLLKLAIFNNLLTLCVCMSCNVFVTSPHLYIRLIVASSLSRHILNNRVPWSKMIKRSSQRIVRMATQTNILFSATFLWPKFSGFLWFKLDWPRARSRANPVKQFYACKIVFTGSSGTYNYYDFKVIEILLYRQVSVCLN
jgi:hypothetical protein